jgi:hypothetical protein
MNSELIVAIAAVAISVISLVASIYFRKSAQEHNRKSVLPIPYLDRSDYEEHAHIRIYNKGTGPMVVTSLTARHPDGAEGQIIDIIPPPPEGYLFSDYTRILDPRPIPPGDYSELLAADFDLVQAEAIQYRNDLRRFLKDMFVRCEYTDVYNSQFSPYEVDCKWFGRHFD